MFRPGDTQHATQEDKLDALEFQDRRKAAESYANTIMESLASLSGDGAFIHERNTQQGRIMGDLLLMNRAAREACEDGNPEWLNTGAAYTATTWLFRLWNDCDAAVGWMVRIGRK